MGASGSPGSEAQRGVSSSSLSCPGLPLPTLVLIPVCPSLLSLCHLGYGGPDPGSAQLRVFPGRRVSRTLRWPGPILVSLRTQGSWDEAQGWGCPSRDRGQARSCGMEGQRWQLGLGAQPTPPCPLQWSGKPGLGPWWTWTPTWPQQGRTKPPIPGPEGSQPHRRPWEGPQLAELRPSPWTSEPQSWTARAPRGGCGAVVPETPGPLPRRPPQLLPPPFPAGRTSCCASPPAWRVSGPERREAGWGRGEAERQVNIRWDRCSAGRPEGPGELGRAWPGRR